MKNLIIFLVFSFTCIKLHSQTKVLLQEGEILQVILNENLDSRISKVGDQVSLEIAEDVIIDTIIIMKKGTLVYGTIAETKEANFTGMQGKLGFTIDYTEAVNGQKIKLRSYQQATGESRTEEIIVIAVIVNPIFLVFKGKDVTIEKGTVYSVYVDKDYELTF